MQIDNVRPVRARRLKIGDTIGIVAPSSPFNRDSFDQGVAAIHRLGFQTRIDPRAYADTGYLAGDDTARADQINAMIADGEVRAIMCARGGYGALRILEYLDYDCLAAHPKALLGFSDITALHQAVFARCNLVTFHGPTVTTLWKADSAGQRRWCDTLTGTRAPAVDIPAEGFLCAGQAQGILVGGNLTVLSHLIGTPYWVPLAGKILLIEDVGEAPYRIDRMLSQMRLAGLLEGIAGVVLGGFERCGDLGQIHRTVVELFAPRGVPVAAGLPVGHVDGNRIVPLGAVVRLDSHAGRLEFPDPVLEEA